MSESLKDTIPSVFGRFTPSKPNLGDYLSRFFYGGVSARKPSEQAKLFNLHFHSVFSKSYDLEHGDSHPKEEVGPGSLISVATCPSEVKKILVKLNLNKAVAVDSIPARLLKCIAIELANPVSWLFNSSFTRAIVPQLWKQANISPIHKDGDTGSVTNYRGVSLLSVVEKCQERIIHTVIYDQVFQYLHDSHHGFLRAEREVYCFSIII